MKKLWAILRRVWEFVARLWRKPLVVGYWNGELEQYKAFRERCLSCTHFRNEDDPGNPNFFCPIWLTVEARATGKKNIGRQIIPKEEIGAYLEEGDPNTKYKCLEYENDPDVDPEERMGTPRTGELQTFIDPEKDLVGWASPPPTGLDARLYGKYEGRPAFILGSGPSILDVKEYLVRDERFGVPDAVYFGANAAGEFADYAVVVEAPTSETAQMIRRAKNGVITRKILDAQLHELGLFPNSRFYLPHRAFDYLPESYQRIALRGEPEMQAGPATFYCAWAAGCNPIIAIGFDFNFLPDRTHYYGEDEATRKQGEHAYRWDETNLITTHMWRAARASGVEIVVVSEISRFLEGLAPRMPIGEAIKRAASKDRLQPVG